MKRKRSEKGSRGSIPIESIAARFRGKGLKLTPQRVAIVRALSKCRGHPTVEEVYREVRKSFPMISLNTVYTTLKLMKGVGELASVGHGERMARFDTNPSPHHHLICVECNRIEDLPFDEVEQQLLPPALVKGRFTVFGYRVEFFGYCESCRGSRKGG
ncbi:MAG: Fur family transcriptional regulator [Candidatus Methylomirabilales bacterium]